MLTYEKISEWLKEKENKDKIVITVGFILVFIVGFGAGSYEKGIRRDVYKPQNNYTTKPAQKPAILNGAPGAVLGTAVGFQTATSSAPTNCTIKGNISASGKKIYHVKGGAFYARVKPEQCFNSEKEAIAAGFVKSSR